MSRTSESEIQVLINFYRLFHPMEVSFVMDLHARLAKLDPTRITFITDHLRKLFNSQHKESDVRALISFFSNPNNKPQIKHAHNLEDILMSHPQTHPILPFTEQCPVCNITLNSDNTRTKEVSIYTDSGQVLPGIVYYLRCVHANNSNEEIAEPILIYPNYTQQKNMKKFTTESIQHGPYVYLGGDYACERQLIERYTSDLVSTPHSWQKQIDSLNLLAFNTNQYQVVKMNMRRFAQMLYIFKIIEMDFCLGGSIVIIPKEIDQFNLWAWSQYPRLLSRFIYLWSNHKTLIGPCKIPNDNCTSCFTIDGHQKARRRVCRTKHVDYLSSDFTKPLVIGCWRTPIRHSLHCEIHQNYRSSTEVATVTSTNKRHNLRKRKLKRQRDWHPKKNIFFGATNCNTNKSKSESYVNKCSRSFGLLAMVSNCKIIVSYAEIFRSETLREIVQLLLNTIRIAGDAFPKIACYDDGCHLVRYVHKNVGKLIVDTTASNVLKSTKFYIDKSHFKNHVGDWCKKNMSPYSNHDLDLINTQCAEQCFAWLKRYAAIISSLGWMRAPLYLLILFHYKNLSTCHVRPTKHFNIDHLVPNVPNISLSHAASLQQDDHLPLSDLNNNLNTNISDITKNIIQSNRFAENNKWMIMSARIPHN
ncbi:unnamed protein product, partial [Adineta steineri]